MANLSEWIHPWGLNVFSVRVAELRAAIVPWGKATLPTGPVAVCSNIGLILPLVFREDLVLWNFALRESIAGVLLTQPHQVFDPPT